MIEVEIKLPVVHLEQVAGKIENLGFEKVKDVREEDTYFDNEFRQILSSDQALRIRKVTDHETGKVYAYTTFKGKKMDSVSMSRSEYEVAISDAAVFEEYLNALGFLAVETKVDKRRREYVKGNMHACMDIVEGLGNFLELEIMVDDENNDADQVQNDQDKVSRGRRNKSRKDQALDEIARVLYMLGYRMDQTITKSYLGLLQKQTK